jgi:tetratricopeptide (TPR) repeat protein
MKPRVPGRDDSLRTALLCAALAALVLGVFLQAVGFGFVFDDTVYVVQNAPIHRGLTWEGVRWAFGGVHLGFWHPLTLMSHMLDVSCFGLDPAGHHLTAVLLHAANVLLCFLVLRACTGAALPSALAAALFAIHPLRAESVAYVSERKDVLSVLFWFLTTAAWLRYARRPSAARYLAALAVFSLGLMAKPMLVTLPCAFLLLDFWPLGRLRLFPPSRGPAVRLALEKVPFLLLSGAASALAIVAEGRYGAMSPVEPFPLPVRLLDVLYSYGWYLGKSVWPSRLGAYYPHPGPAIPGWALAASAAALVAVSWLTLRALRRLPFLGVGWLWYLGTLVPVIGFVQIGDTGMADRFTYVPSVGLAVGVAWGLQAWCAGDRRRTALAAAASVAVVLALAAAGFLQTRHWRDGVALFSRTVAVTGVNPLARYNLAVALLEAGRPGDAEREFRRTLDQSPGYLPAYGGLSTILFDSGRRQEAIDTLEAGLSRAPRSPRLHVLLGARLMELKRTDEAAAHLEEALRLRPGRADAHLSLGIIRAGQGRLDEAERHFAAALAADPSSEEARENLRALGEMRRQGAPDR